MWSESDYPLIPVGTLTLDRNPDCYREQVEKLAFSPSNLLEGRSCRQTKMLQGRSFIYTDAQRYRLGQDFRRSKVNGQADWRADCQAPSGIGVEACGVQERTDICRQDDFTQAGSSSAPLPGGAGASDGKSGPEPRGGLRGRSGGPCWAPVAGG